MRAERRHLYLNCQERIKTKSKYDVSVELKLQVEALSYEEAEKRVLDAIELSTGARGRIIESWRLYDLSKQSGKDEK